VCGGKVTTEKIIFKIHAYYKLYFKTTMSREGTQQVSLQLPLFCSTTVATVLSGQDLHYKRKIQQKNLFIQGLLQ
jgi:hypothetical protein